MNGEQIVRIFLIRRWWIVGSVILGALVGAGLATALPHVYDVKAQVIVSMAESTDVSAVESGTYIDDLMPNVLEVSRSNDFAHEVSKGSGVDRSTAQIRDSLDFVLVPDTSVIEVHVQDQDPGQARVLANRAAQTMSTSFLTDRLGSVSSLDVSVLQRSESSADGAYPDLVRFVGLGALAGLVLGLLLAPIRHGLDPRLRDFGDIRRTLGTEMLAVRMRKPSGAIRRQAANCGASTSISGLLARLDLTGRRRGSTVVTLCGVGGVGNQLAADLVETAAASGMSCALVSADPAELSTSHYRELSQVTGISVVDANSLSGESLLIGRALADALCAVLADYDLVICLSSDFAAHPQTCSFLELSDIAVVVTAPHPVWADLRSTQELLRAGESLPVGFVLVDPPLEADSDIGTTNHRRDAFRKPAANPAVTESVGTESVSSASVGATSAATTSAGSVSATTTSAGHDTPTKELDMVPGPRAGTALATPTNGNNANGGQS